MRKFRRPDAWIVIKSVALIMIFAKDLLLYSNGLVKPVKYYLLVYSLLSFILMVNDLFRFFYLRKKENAYCISLITSILVSGIVFEYFSSTGIYLYYLLLLYDVEVLTLGMTVYKRRLNVFIHSGIYCLALAVMCLRFELDLHENVNNMYRMLGSTSFFDLRFILPNGSYQPWASKTKMYFWYAAPPLLVYLLTFMVFYQASLKKKFQSLNEKYKEANRKLESHANTVEELAIANERNRIAQDMHDSLGHSLTALIMNLEVMERINEKELSKMKDLIVKCQHFARNALTSVRKAVYTLKDKDGSKSFSILVKEMIENLQDTGGSKIDFTCSDGVESLTPDIQNTLYRTIQESITNSMKHGNAQWIGITIGVEHKQVFLGIEDNGTGTKQIIRSNGLEGIEKRIHAAGGHVEFYSAASGGFKTVVTIPL